MKRPVKGKTSGRGGKPLRRGAKANAAQDAAEEPREVRAGTQAGYHAPTRAAHRKGLSKKLVEKEREEAPAREQREREQREYERRQREMREQERRDQELRDQPKREPAPRARGASIAPRGSSTQGARRNGPLSTSAAGKGAPHTKAPHARTPDARTPDARTPHTKTPNAKTPRPKAPSAAPVVRPPVPADVPSAPDSGLTVRVSRILNVPASAVFRAVNDPDKRGWAPTQLFRIVSVLAPRFIRLAFPDGTLVAMSVARQGNARCTVSLELTKLPVGTDERMVKATWDEALSGLQEQLDASWD